jgi:hypothetical protein
MPSINIPIQDARNAYTQASLGVWTEELPVSSLFRSYFTNKVMPTKNVSLEVRRSNRLISTDIARGSEGNKNKGGQSTSRLYQPPYYAENFNSTDLMLYDQIMGSYSEAVAPELLKNAIEEIKDYYALIKLKMERAYEKQCSEVLQTGIVTLKTQDTIPFSPKATHIQTLSTKWDATTPKIYDSIKNQCNILKQDGASAVEFDLICGEAALVALQNSAEYLEKAKIYSLSIDKYIMPKLDNITGAVFINRIPIGQYIINIWSYAEYYDDATGRNNQFLDPKKVVLVAKSFQGNLAFGAVPRILTENGMLGNQQFNQIVEAGAFLMTTFPKPEVSAQVFEMKSAGLAVPTTIDHFACLTVLA